MKAGASLSALHFEDGPIPNQEMARSQLLHASTFPGGLGAFGESFTNRGVIMWGTYSTGHDVTTPYGVLRTVSFVNDLGYCSKR
jgi:hypothetical protein